MPAKQATRRAVAAAAPSAASASPALPADKPPLTPEIPQERTEAAEIRALRKWVRALEQQLASAAAEAPGEATRSQVKGGKAQVKGDELPSAAVAAALAIMNTASVGFLQYGAEPPKAPAMPHALMLALRGLDEAGLRREFDKHADKAEGERRLSKAGLASFMRDKGLAHGEEHTRRPESHVEFSTSNYGLHDHSFKGVGACERGRQQVCRGGGEGGQRNRDGHAGLLQRRPDTA